MEQWHNEHAILRDLSLAQGRQVPVQKYNTISSNEKPPALYLKEDTEEEYYSTYVGDGDCNGGPDLHLIQQMLEAVRERNISEIEDPEDTNKDTLIQFSKGSVTSNGQSNPESLTKQATPRKSRNVALQSLIAAYGDGSLDDQNNLRPTSENKEPPRVNGVKSPMFTKNMFKRKTAKKTEVLQDDKPKESIVKRMNEPAAFVPSSFASERYKKYMETSQLKDQVNNDIWSVAEQKMKEMDEKRKQSAAAASTSSSPESIASAGVMGMDLVRLSQHRHLLTGDCVDCEVLCEKRKEKHEILQRNEQS